MSTAHRLKLSYKFAYSPTIKIGIGQHHPTIAFVISYLLLAGIVKNILISLLFISNKFYIMLISYSIKYFAVGLSLISVIQLYLYFPLVPNISLSWLYSHQNPHTVYLFLLIEYNHIFPSTG